MKYVGNGSILLNKSYQKFKEDLMSILMTIRPP